LHCGEANALCKNKFLFKDESSEQELKNQITNLEKKVDELSKSASTEQKSIKEKSTKDKNSKTNVSNEKKSMLKDDKL